MEDTKKAKGRKSRLRDQPKECHLRGPMEAGVFINKNAMDFNGHEIWMETNELKHMLI